MGNEKKELQIVETDALTSEEKTELSANIDRLIEAHKNNRQAINRLVFESVAAMTEADDAATTLSRKGRISRWIGGITGTNQKLQNTINKNRSAAQYASQQTLQKLAEQNLMTFDLITAVNNKLNASLNSVNDEFARVYEGLGKFFRHNRNELARLESRLEKVEQNVNLLTWQNSIEYQEFEGTEYEDLDDVSKIVCLTRDFYEITKGNWSTSDLLLLKTAMATIDIQPKEKINYFNAIKEISDNDALKAKLLGGKIIQRIEDPGYLISMSTLKKLEACRTDEKYTVDAVTSLLEENGINSDEDKICAALTKKYLANEALVNVDMNVESYDFMLDLLYNLQEAKEEGLLFDANQNTLNDVNLDAEVSIDDRATHLYEEALKYYAGDGVVQDDNKAFELFLKAADSGLAEAQYYVGIMYDEGVGVKQNSKKAFEWIEKSAEQGDVDAQFYLGLLYMDSEAIEQDYEKAIEWLNEAAEQGNPMAQNQLGMMYLEGNEIKRNLNEAKLWFEKAAEQGVASSQWALGMLYEKGVGVQKDTNKAIVFYEKAAEQNLPLAQYRLGVVLKEGNGVKKDVKRAFKLIQKAAEQDLAEAKILVGEMYENGQGVPRDYDEAANWYRNAIENNDTVAMFKLANLYERGYGLNEDNEDYGDELALGLYTKAAEKGLLEAQYKLGEIYSLGNEAVEADEFEAEKWYRMAAEGGFAEAQYELGEIYYIGNDAVEEDNKEAKKWYRKAAQQGHEGAKKALKNKFHESKVEQVSIANQALHKEDSLVTNIGLAYADGLVKFGGITGKVTGGLIRRILK